MILSHHGEPEFGAAVRPMCAESELLSELDKLDSRMEIYREALSDLNEGEFSQRIFALEKKIYRRDFTLLVSRNRWTSGFRAFYMGAIPDELLFYSASDRAGMVYAVHYDQLSDLLFGLSYC